MRFQNGPDGRTISQSRLVPWITSSSFGALLVILFLLSRANYLLFHSLVEAFTIVVACGIFMIAWNSRRFQENGYFLVLGVAFLQVGLLDILHTLAYKNMGVFPGQGSDLPTQLWIAARWLQAGALFVAPFLLTRRPEPFKTVAVVSAVTALLLASIFPLKIFPHCFLEDTGLTAFKIGNELLIVLLLFACWATLRRKRRFFDPKVLRLLKGSLAAFILSELAFTLYTDVFGLSNMAGHLLKAVSFYFVYQAVIETGISRPYDILFRGLKESGEALRETRDELELRILERTAELTRLNRELTEENASRKEAEERIRILNAELEQRVLERTAQLESANRELEAFSYSVSHDLRSPLRGINAFSQALLEEYAERLNEKGKDYLVRVRLAAQRMGRLIDEMLKLSRISRHDIKREEVDLSAVARGVAEGLHEADPERRVQIVITDGLAVQGDPALLRAVLENLMGNSWKFTGPRDKAIIEFGSVTTGERTAYFVRDNGAGFDMTYASKLFTPFQRLHGFEEFAGSGIGLSIVQRVIRRHGGEVWGEGEVDRGATFYFTIGCGE